MEKVQKIKSRIYFDVHTHTHLQKRHFRYTCYCIACVILFGATMNWGILNYRGKKRPTWAKKIQYGNYSICKTIWSANKRKEINKYYAFTADSFSISIWILLMLTEHFALFSFEKFPFFSLDREELSIYRTLLQLFRCHFSWCYVNFSNCWLECHIICNEMDAIFKCPFFVAPSWHCIVVSSVVLSVRYSLLDSFFFGENICLEFIQESFNIANVYTSWRNSNVIACMNSFFFFHCAAFIKFVNSNRMRRNKHLIRQIDC